MLTLKHDYSFDPAYGYTLPELLQVGNGDEPEGYDSFWQARYQRALAVQASPVLTSTQRRLENWREFDLKYHSTDGMELGGWCLLPKHGEVKRVFVVLHGYGGRDAPDLHLPFEDAALLFPTARGISRSQHATISSNPLWHVIHDIQDRDKYVHGGCVEDVWTAVSAAMDLFPQCEGRVGLLGISFGGGIGAMALGYDARIAKAHFNVPSFGHQMLRLKMRTTGSGAAVQAAHRRNPAIVEKTIRYFDAALSAKRITVPVHFACALFDPMVAPPGQFAVYNAVSSEKALFVLRAGHFDYPEQEQEAEELLRELHNFFRNL